MVMQSRIISKISIQLREIYI